MSPFPGECSVRIDSTLLGFSGPPFSLLGMLSASTALGNATVLWSSLACVSRSLSCRFLSSCHDHHHHFPHFKSPIRGANRSCGDSVANIPRSGRNHDDDEQCRASSCQFEASIRVAKNIIMMITFRKLALPVANSRVAKIPRYSRDHDDDEFPRPRASSRQLAVPIRVCNECSHGALEPRAPSLLLAYVFLLFFETLFRSERVSHVLYSRRGSSDRVSRRLSAMSAPTGPSN